MSSSTDPRSLIVRVLAASRRAARNGLTALEIVAFLEGSFGAFLQKLRQPAWAWSPDALRRNLEDLLRHGLVEKDADGRHTLTPLGLVAGETTTEVASVISLVSALRALTPEQISDPTLIAAVQATSELDDVYITINTRSAQKEPQAWSLELARQGVPGSVLRTLERGVREQHDEVKRKKRAVACLLYVSGQEMAEIERILTQFGGGFDVAGAVRGVAARTSDLLPAAMRIARLLHPTLEVDARRDRLVARLTYGVSGEIAELAQVAGNSLQRGDYRRLVASKLGSVTAIGDAKDDVLLACVDRDRSRLNALRIAVETIVRRGRPAPTIPVPTYVP